MIPARRTPSQLSRGLMVCGTFLVACLVYANSVNAFALRLSGPFGSARPALGVANVLFYAELSGRVEELLRIGDTAPDGGRLVDLGVPAIAPDGRVVLGVEVKAGATRSRWEIVALDPRRPSANKLTPITLNAATSRDCSPRLQVDPYPVTDDYAALIFAAPSHHGGDGLFVVADGEISCLTRVGERTDKGRRIKTLGFGSVQAGGDRQVAMLATLEGERSAVLLVSRHGVAEVAVEGEAAPGGQVFSRNFGLPAISVWPGGLELAFTNSTPAGSALFLHRNGKTTRALAVGTSTSAGELGFLSPGRPAMIGDAAVAVLGACNRVQAMFVLRRDGQGSPVTAATAAGWGLSHLGDPYLTSSGATLFGAMDADDREQLYVLSPNGELSPFAWKIEFATLFDSAALGARIFSGTLTTNARGQFAFLGGG